MLNEKSISGSRRYHPIGISTGTMKNLEPRIKKGLIFRDKLKQLELTFKFVIIR